MKPKSTLRARPDFDRLEGLTLAGDAGWTGATALGQIQALARPHHPAEVRPHHAGILSIDGTSAAGAADPAGPRSAGSGGGAASAPGTSKKAASSSDGGAVVPPVNPAKRSGSGRLTATGAHPRAASAARRPQAANHGSRLAGSSTLHRPVAHRPHHRNAAGQGSAAATASATPAIVSVLGGPPTTPQKLTVSAGGPYRGFEGVPVTLTASAAGGKAGYTYAWDLDRNGSFETPGRSVQAVFPDNGKYAVNVRVADATGKKETATATVMVANIAPTAILINPPVSGQEGQTITLRGTAADPSPVDTAAGLPLTWSVAKDGQPFASGSGGSISFTPDDNATYTARLTAADKDGGVGTATSQIVISNVAPTAAAGGPYTITAGQPLTFGGSAIDPSPVDTSAGLSYTWDFGDGSAAVAGLGLAAPSHTYGNAGTYAATLTVTDKDGGTSVASAASVTVMSSTPLPHAGDPIKQDEHMALFALVPDSQATVTSVKSGNWGDPKTWSTGVVPGDGDHVVIEQGQTVTVDGVYDRARVGWLRVDGTLQFEPDVNTALKAVTTAVNVQGTVDVGTADAPIQAGVTARFIIGDRGVRDDAMRAYDPYDFTGGFISHGATRIFGAPHASSVQPAVVPRPGDTTLTLGAPATGWSVGDSLLLPGLDPEASQEEARTIAAISADGLTITLSAPLAYSHGGIYGYEEAAPVGDLTRNVVFSSEDPSDISRRGHVMFMHSMNVVIDGAEFLQLGRTDALRTHTIPTLDDGGMLVPGTDDNTLGRYAVHFHVRSGANYGQTPFVIRNSAVVGSPKNGIVNHGGYGLIDNNVVYDAIGSGIFTENGSEIGRITGNLIVGSSGSDDNTDSRTIPGQETDYGHDGNGIWLQGGGVAVTDNVAIGNRHGFTFFPTSIRDDSLPGLDYAVFLAKNLPDPGLAHGAEYMDVNNVPLFTFARNVAINNRVGLNTWTPNLFSVANDAYSLITDSRFINNATGWANAYSRQVIVRNTTFIGGDPTQFGRTYFRDWGILGNVETTSIVLDNVTVDGYANGYGTPGHGTNVIRGGLINGLHKIYVPAAYGGSLTIEGVAFGTMAGEAPYKISLDNHFQQDEYRTTPLLLQPQVILYNGQNVYYDGQAADYVPFDGTVRSLGPELDGLTNQQLWDRYRLAIGGHIAPAGLVASADIVGGSLGPAVAFDPAIDRQPSVWGVYGWQVAHVWNYPPGYSATVTIAGAPYFTDPKDMHWGWNVLTLHTDLGTRAVLTEI